MTAVPPGPAPAAESCEIRAPLACYAELHVRSNFTFLTAASHPEELVERAAACGLQALAITDVNTLAGVVRAHVEAKRVGLPLIIGAELQFQDGPRAVLLAMSRAGYANLSHVLTIGRRRAPKGECYLQEADVLLELEPSAATHALRSVGAAFSTLVPTGSGPWASRATDVSERAFDSAPPLRLLSAEAPRHTDLIAILLEPDPRDRFRSSGQGTEAISHNLLARWRATFGDRLYLGLCRHLQAGDLARTRALAELADTADVPVVAVNSVEMHERARKPLHDVLACIREKTTLDRVGWHRLPNAEPTIKAPAQIARIFHDMPEAVARSVEIARRIRHPDDGTPAFTLDQLRFEYPDEYVPPGESPTDYLRRLTFEGAATMYPDGDGGMSAVPAKVRQMCEYELSLIEELEYEPYFLTIHDIVQFARNRHILCQGRGSAANSAVCYCLGITAVDPATSNLLFERFISRERNEPPDIDVDFEHERREEVIQYVYEKYGRDHAAMVCEVIRYRGRSSLRDVGKALGLSLDQVERLAKLRSHWSDGVPDFADLQRAGLSGRDRRVALTLQLSMEIQHFPRHLGIHVGGFVITRGLLSELVPVENATMADRTVIQWDKNDAESLGLLKVDCLALGMLTAIRKTFELVERVNGVKLDLATLPDDDAPTWTMIQRADTVGVFQIESRGQMSMLVRMKPACFYDLVIEVAIMRPGPIQGGMVHPYLRRRNGTEKVEYPIPELEPVLKRTLGVPLFQEQCMQLAVVAAGFTPGEADQLRRAISAWRSHGKIGDLRDKLIAGMLARGIELQYAERVFEQISGFGDYGFPESHAASFALIAWASCYLKAWYPAHFIGSVINSLPMGFYSTSALTQDVKRWGIEVRPVDVTICEYDCTLEELDEEEREDDANTRASSKRAYTSTLFNLDGEGEGETGDRNRDRSSLTPVQAHGL